MKKFVRLYWQPKMHSLRKGPTGINGRDNVVEDNALLKPYLTYHELF